MFKFRFGGQGSSSPTQPPSIETVRRRARHRLLGATVLVLAGVIGFPLLFESQPRLVPVDFEIDIPSRQAAKPQAEEAIPPSGRHVAGLDESEEFVPSAPGAPAPASVTPSAPAVPAAPVAPAPQPAKAPVEPPAAVAASVPVPLHPVVKPMPPAPAVQAVAPAKPEPRPAEQARPADKPVEKPPAKPARANEDSARALALLEGKSAPPAASTDADKAAGKSRHVVQVGAFVDPNLAQEARMKLERAGLPSYTQISNTPDGPRTRVRLGPFATRAEADKAAAKARALGLSAAILAL